MFPKKGKVFSSAGNAGLRRSDYCDAVSKALERELGSSHRAIKTLMRWTGANEKTAKNWLSGQHGPSGENLVVLLVHSEEVLKTVLSLADRSQLLAATDLVAAREGLLTALKAVDASIGEAGG